MRAFAIRVGTLAGFVALLVALSNLVPAVLFSKSPSAESRTRGLDFSAQPTSKPKAKPASSLTPEMNRRVGLAIAAADRAGVALGVESGWRSTARQKWLHERAIRRYGSSAEARKWVLPANESAHPKGTAVDVGPPAGAKWLEKYGYKYGLCRPYDNEEWHFEPLVSPGTTCPPRKPHAG